MGLQAIDEGEGIGVLGAGGLAGVGALENATKKTSQRGRGGSDGAEPSTPKEGLLLLPW